MNQEQFGPHDFQVILNDGSLAVVRFHGSADAAQAKAQDFCENKGLQDPVYIGPGHMQ